MRANPPGRLAHCSVSPAALHGAGPADPCNVSSVMALRLWRPDRAGYLAEGWRSASSDRSRHMPTVRPCHWVGCASAACWRCSPFRRGQTISTDRLIDELWGEDLPANPSNALQALVSRLRRAVGSDAIVTAAPGYFLDVPPEAVDAARFRTLVEAARSESDSASRRRLFREALSLWRGPGACRISVRGVCAEGEFRSRRNAAGSCRRTDCIRPRVRWWARTGTRTGAARRRPPPARKSTGGARCLRYIGQDVSRKVCVRTRQPGTP